MEKTFNHGSRRVYTEKFIPIKEETRLENVDFMSVGVYKDGYNSRPLVVVDGKILGYVDEIKILLEQYHGTE